MVVRSAVGASRWRLIRQLLTESIVLGMLAGLAGAWLARLGVVALMALAPADLPRTDEIQVDLVALLFALLIAFGASIVFGLMPALQTSRVRLATGSREGGKGTSIGAGGNWARSAFVVAEIALAVALVAGAGVLARSLAALAAVNMGFKPERLLVLRRSSRCGASMKRRARPRFIETSCRGASAAGRRRRRWRDEHAHGHAVERQLHDRRIDGASGGSEVPQAILNVVTPDYFRPLRVPVTRGRDFSDADTSNAPLVAIVNEALVRAAFGNEDPIGRRIQCGLDRDFMTIVGVVADVRTTGPWHQSRRSCLTNSIQARPRPST